MFCSDTTLKMFTYQVSTSSLPKFIEVKKRYIVFSNKLFEIFVFIYLFKGRWITLMELLPAFSLYRVVYEFSQSILAGRYMASSGIQCVDLSDPTNGLAGVLTIMILEWFLFLLSAFYLDRFGSLTNGIRRLALLVRSWIVRKHFQAAQQQNTQLQEFRASIEVERADVIKEVCSALFCSYTSLSFI